jgi:hypothetical protein
VSTDVDGEALQPGGLRLPWRKKESRRLTMPAFPELPT